MHMTTPLARRVSHAVVAAACVLGPTVLSLHGQPALDGQPALHDPSTVIVESGKYYVYATGGGHNGTGDAARERSGHVHEY